jgi:sensor histidine kinase YesM
VVAVNSSGVRSEQADSFEFSIARPFWWQWWFIGLAILVLILLGFLLLRIKLRNTREKAMINTQMIDLKLQALRAQMNPHFIFNALTSIQFFYAKNDDITANKYMTQFASLIRETLNSSRKNFNTIQDEVDVLDKYIGLETLRLDKTTNYTLEIGEEIDKNSIEIPTMLLQPLVENAIIHGVRHTIEDVGILKIKFTAISDILHIVVEDNGPGFHHAQSKHQSKGLEITNQRIETMNQIYSLNLKMVIRPLTDDSGSCIGTQVKLSMHIKK